MTQYRLKARAELNGAIREPGYVFTLAEGELGPHRTVVASNHGAQITDHMNAEQELVDEPLYEEISEHDAEVEKEKLEPVDPNPELTEAKVRIETLEADLADSDDLNGKLMGELKAMGEAASAKDAEISRLHAKMVEWAEKNEHLQASHAKLVQAPKQEAEAKPGDPLLLEAPDSNLPKRV